jgi:ABC-type antimicrobial peptide transport system permease subunit
LASVGLYGTLSYAVNVRRREVAVRMALGALQAQVARQFLVEGLAITILGCMVGLAFATVFARMLSSMLYGVSTTDAITLCGVMAIMLAVSVLASLFPAIRAARLDPMQALREE